MSEVDSVISDIEVSTSAEHAVNDSYDGDNDDDDNNNDVVAPSDDQDRDEDSPQQGVPGASVEASKPQSARVLREGTRTLSASRPLSQPTSSPRSPRYKPVTHSEQLRLEIPFKKREPVKQILCKIPCDIWAMRMLTNKY